MTTAAEAFWRTGDHPFVLLTTFRRNGLGVATPVWMARDGDHLVVTTPANSKKVDRLRRDERVLMSPCGRLGRVASGTPVVSARAEIAGVDDEHPSAVAALRAKYGPEYRAIISVERSLRRRRGEQTQRLILVVRQQGTASCAR